MDKQYYVYIMTNKHDRVLYTGMTNNLENRVYQHKNKTLKGFTLNQNSQLPQVISDNLRNILSVSQPASHRSHIDEHLNLVNTNYLIKGIIFQLLDVIVWFKKFIDSNPDSKNWIREYTQFK